MVMKNLIKVIDDTKAKELIELGFALVSIEHVRIDGSAVTIHTFEGDNSLENYVLNHYDSGSFFFDNTMNF
jgi:hypothetical protein